MRVPWMRRCSMGSSRARRTRRQKADTDNYEYHKSVFGSVNHGIGCLPSQSVRRPKIFSARQKIEDGDQFSYQSP